MVTGVLYSAQPPPPLTAAEKVRVGIRIACWLLKRSLQFRSCSLAACEPAC